MLPLSLSKNNPHKNFSMTIFKNFKTLMLVLLVMIFSINNILAQNGTVTGVVKDADGTALTGASLSAIASAFRSTTLAGADGELHPAAFCCDNVLLLPAATV